VLRRPLAVRRPDRRLHARRAVDRPGTTRLRTLSRRHRRGPKLHLTRPQQAATLLALLVVLGALGWVLVPFHASTGDCSQGALRLAGDRYPVYTTTTGVNYGFQPGETPPASDLFGQAAQDVSGTLTPCGTAARLRLWTAGIIAVLTLVGAAVALVVLRPSSSPRGSFQ
jgi:hypothetical protein